MERPARSGTALRSCQHHPVRINISLYVSDYDRILFSDPCGARSRRRGNASATARSPIRCGTHGQRAGDHSGPVAASRIAPSEAADRGRAGGAAPRGRLGLLLRWRIVPAWPNWRATSSAGSIPRMRRWSPIGPASPRCGPRARLRPNAISPRRPPIGTSSARCMSPRSGSRRRCSKRSARARSMRCSISAPAPAACLNCWRPGGAGGRRSTAARPC